MAVQGLRLPGELGDKPYLCRIAGLGIVFGFVSAAPSGGESDYAPGCILQDTTNGHLYLNTGTNTSATWVSIPTGPTAAARVVAGQHTTVAASDTVVTGLTTVTSVVASLDSDPVDDPFMVTASIGDQAGTPAAGSVLINTWKNTGGTDPTPAAATTFGKLVNWIAWGT